MADDFIGTILWNSLFLEFQTVEVYHNILMQDNKSDILLESNGMKSPRKRSCHLDIHYFFVKDVAQEGKLVIAL